MNDTLEFISYLRKYDVKIDALIVKPYSLDNDCAKIVEEMQLPLYRLVNSPERDGRMCEAILQEASMRSAQDGKHIIILDLGGEYAEILSKGYEYVDVVVEDTAIGHRIYERYTYSENIIYSVARSRMKGIEARFVGSTVAYSAEQIFRSIGKTLYAKRVLVIGYGLIGRNAAITLQKMGCKVEVKDSKQVNELEAYFDGLEVCDKTAKYPDIIFGITGYKTVEFEDVSKFSDVTYLISGSSKQVEFDIKGLKEKADKENRINDNITCYEIKGKKFFLFYDGFPVNFLFKSIPDCIIDFMFAEMIVAIGQAMDNEIIKCNGVNYVDEDGINEISNTFLRKGLWGEKYGKKDF
ncbi:NAD(P)-dependent oxidoreductase [Clostridium tepidiprofundi]|nr:NAD(P)-dependent oxidoreductase [Clostridium tepidiprofundi]